MQSLPEDPAQREQLWQDIARTEAVLVCARENLERATREVDWQEAARNLSYFHGCLARLYRRFYTPRPDPTDWRLG